MATAPQAAMEMPQQGANPFADPNTMAVYDQMRQEISPQEFSNEMLAGAAQIDPQAVAAFTKELQGLDIPPQALDALNNVVDEILASPDKYAELRKKYMDMGLPEEVLPEQFDPQFFAALNMAIDQMIAAPTGVQAFAKGGIAELKPIAKAIASYGRNGDTMLAHITPAEARMLRRRGGSGTINPNTGLPEFFLKKLWKTLTAPIRAVGKAVQSFAKSSIGRIVLPIALGFFLGPAAAGLLGVTSVAGVAAVSGFVGSSLSTLAAGGNLGQALKAGAMGGLTAGAGAGVFGGADSLAANSYKGATTIGGQVDAFKAMLPGGGPAVPATVTSAPGPSLSAANAAPVPPTDSLDNFLKSNNAFETAASSPAASSAILRPTAPGAEFGIGDPGAGFEPTYAPGKTPYSLDLANTVARDSSVPAGAQGLNKAPSLVDQAKDFYNKNISPSGIQEAGQEKAMSNTLAKFPGTTSSQVLNAPANSVLGKAYQAALPGVLSTYGPMAAIGAGALSAFGGFKTEPVQPSAINQSLMTPVTQRIRQDGTQRQMYLQNMPGVVYDQYGEPTDGYRRLPTYDVPDYNAGGYGMYSASGQGIMNVPTVYNTPSGSIGSSRVEQPYNTASMYSNIMPRRYADGGEAAPVSFDWKKYLEANTDLARVGIDTEEKAKAHWFGSGVKEGRPMNPEEYATQRATQAAADASNLAARTKVAQDKAMRKAQGSGNMYANINAGLAALAPETFPGAPVTVSPERRAVLDAAFRGTSTDIQKSRVMRDNMFSPEEITAYVNLDYPKPRYSYGEINRRYNTALRQDAYAPMLEEQRNAMNQQRDIAANVPATPVKGEAVSQPSSGGGISIQGGTDKYGNLYGSQPYHYGEGAPPVSGTAAQPFAANPYSNITTPVAPPTSMPAPFFKPGDPNSPYYQGSLPPGSFPANGGNVDPFYQQRMGLDAQVNARNSQGQNATPAQLAEMRRLSELSENDPGVNARRDALNEEARRRGTSTTFMNMGGIAGLAAGGYPRRNGQINGPGTEKSDSIPAMLSDGEFVMTAKAVRGAGKGSRRAGAKKMYKLMHQLEKNSERG